MPKSKRLFSAVSKRDSLLPYLFVAPAILVLLALSIYPLLYSVSISLRTETNNGIVWGLNNFARLTTDSFFFTALLHTLIYATAALVCEFFLGLGLALLLNRQLRARGLFRATL